MNKSTKTRKLTVMAMLCALAYLFMFTAKILKLHIVPSVSFLTYDPKDIIIIIGGFIYGPLSSFIISIAVSLIEMFTVSETGPIGFIMNVLSTCTFACTASFIYKKCRTVTGAVAGLLIGIFTATAAMLLWNYLITPIYQGIPREAIVKLMLPGFLPFNLIKNGLNAAITMMLYKSVKKILIVSNMLPKTDNPKVKGKTGIGIVLISLFIIITLMLIILVLKEMI